MILQNGCPVLTRTQLVKSFVIVRVEVPKLDETYPDRNEVGSFLVKTHPENAARNFVSRHLFPRLEVW